MYTKRDPRPAPTGFAAAGPDSVATGPGLVAAGCTPRSDGMYISRSRKWLIINSTKAGLRNVCAAPLSFHKDTKFFPVFQIGPFGTK